MSGRGHCSATGSLVPNNHPSGGAEFRELRFEHILPVLNAPDQRGYRPAYVIVLCAYGLV